MAVVEIHVAASGRVEQVTLVKSTGFPDLDNATVRSMLRCKFRPATYDGKPVATRWKQQFVWTLD